MSDITKHISNGLISSDNFIVVNKVDKEKSRSTCGRYLLFSGDKYYPDSGVMDLTSHSDQRYAWEDILSKIRNQDNHYGPWYQIVDKETMSVLEEGETDEDIFDILHRIDIEMKSLRKVSHD